MGSDISYDEPNENARHVTFRKDHGSPVSSICAALPRRVRHVPQPALMHGDRRDRSMPACRHGSMQRDRHALAGRPRPKPRQSDIRRRRDRLMRPSIASRQTAWLPTADPRRRLISPRQCRVQARPRRHDQRIFLRPGGSRDPQAAGIESLVPCLYAKHTTSDANSAC